MKFRTEEVIENRFFASLRMTRVRGENINGEKPEIRRGEKKNYATAYIKKTSRHFNQNA